MSMLGTLLVLLIVSVVFLFMLLGVIFDRVDQHKRETLRRKRETAQRRSGTVVSIEHNRDLEVYTGPQRGADQLRISLHPFRISVSPPKYDMDTYFLMVEWTDPQTQSRVTSPTRVMPALCPYHRGDEVFIYVHPDLQKVWLDEPRHVHDFFQ